MSTPLKDILILGASGSVGTPILTALLSIPTFTITILTRTSSTANFPPHIPLKKVSDAFTVAELTTAFKDQDAVVVALTTSSVTQDDLAVRIIDAAVAAGVKRLIPSEFGTDNLDPRARRLVPIYDAKGRTLEYLIKRAEESDGALTWTSVACGSWYVESQSSYHDAISMTFFPMQTQDADAEIGSTGASTPPNPATS
jgi:nucleoside-diphosphate-sugar epimerase